jgi:hypothetical protein
MGVARFYYGFRIKCRGRFCFARWSRGGHFPFK